MLDSYSVNAKGFIHCCLVNAGFRLNHRNILKLQLLQTQTLGLKDHVIWFQKAQA